ncbi:hypothetical protein [Streptomyces sp. NPDC001927]
MRTDDRTQGHDDERDSSDATQGDDPQADDVRALLCSWSEHTVPAADDPASGTALDVPPADAAEVTDAVLGLLGRPAGPPPPAGPDAPGGRSAALFDELCRIARALVVDEHPSAAGWTEDERVGVAHWTAILIARDGEEGVQALLRELRRRDPRGH